MLNIKKIAVVIEKCCKFKLERRLTAGGRCATYIGGISKSARPSDIFWGLFKLASIMWASRERTISQHVYAGIYSGRGNDG